MRLFVDKRYLKLPIRHEATHKSIRFLLEGKLAYDLEARIDAFEPDRWYYVDLTRFLGMSLDIEIEPEVEVKCELCDDTDEAGLYREKYRPAVHFTAPRGWNNDPNGLFWYNGLYHLFYQYNPLDRTWENMHWGHAVSGDLLHWENRPIALFPDELGAIFSGSAVVDSRNLLNLKENENDVIVLYYTAWGGITEMSPRKKAVQCMAYSTDGGDTFRKYADNPIVDQIVAGNRDPKVVWNAAQNQYVMGLYLAGGRYAFLTSTNLAKWKKVQELALPEDRECPDCYTLTVEGSKEAKWVFSGANDRYIIGKLTDRGFVPEQSVKRLQYGLDSHYAAQTYFNLPQGDARKIRMSWNRARIPDSSFAGAMGTPMEMKLRRIDDFLCLCALPVAEWEKLRKSTCAEKSISLRAGEKRVWPLVGKSQDISLRVGADCGPFVVCLLGLNIEVCPENNMLRCGEMTMPLYKRDAITLRLITDTNGCEVYADQGEAIMGIPHVSDYSLNRLEISATERNVNIEDIRLSALESVCRKER